MKLEVGDVCVTLDPKPNRDWKSAGRICTIERFQTPGDVVVIFHDGDGWDGGRWGMPVRYLKLYGEKGAYETDE